MTLNLMVTSRHAVYLSGDFRLTYPDGAKWRWEDDGRVQKLIPAFKFGWSALASFTGVATLADGARVGDEVSRIVDALSFRSSFDALLNALAGLGQRIGRGVSDKRLAFTVVGFIGRRPAAAVVSNFTDLSGRTFAPGPGKLQVYKAKPKEPDARAAGDVPAVSRDDLASLRQLLKRSRDPREVQREMAAVNERASQRANSVSPECVTGHLLPTGRAEITPHGIPDGLSYVPEFVSRGFERDGIGFPPKLDEKGNPLPPRWVGMTASLHGEPPNRIVSVVHAMRNVSEPIRIRPPSIPPGTVGTHILWKIAGPNEPERYTFEIQHPRSP